MPDEDPSIHLLSDCRLVRHPTDDSRWHLWLASSPTHGPVILEGSMEGFRVLAHHLIRETYTLPVSKLPGSDRTPTPEQLEEATDEIDSWNRLTRHLSSKGWKMPI